jgi:hypothetical protein
LKDKYQLILWIINMPSSTPKPTIPLKTRVKKRIRGRNPPISPALCISTFRYQPDLGGF